MDASRANEGVILIAATNRPDCSIRRCCPPRFDRRCCRTRTRSPRAILKGHSASAAGAHVNLKTIARARRFLRRPDEPRQRERPHRRPRATSDGDPGRFEEAKDKVMMAPSASRCHDREEKLLTAYHEAGHAIVGLNVPADRPIHKATIIPRGRALAWSCSSRTRQAVDVAEQMTSRSPS